MEIRLALFLCALMSLTSACGGSGGAIAPPTPAPPTASPAAIYPAFQPPWPTVVPITTPPITIANPKLVPVFFADTPDQSNLLAMLSRLNASSEWAVLGQYGVDSISSITPIVLSEAAPASIDASAIDSYIASRADNWGAPDPSKIFILFFPNVTNADASGWHTSTTTTAGHTIVYAVDAQYVSTYVDGYLTFHEIAEAASDPFFTGYGYLNRDWVAWENLVGGTEIGDMCLGGPFFDSNDLGIGTRNAWSNSAVSLGKDPCGNPASSPGFGAFPVLTGGAGHNAAMVIPPGTSATIPVRLYSYGPLIAPMSLKALQLNLNSGGTNALTFSFDKTTGQNGDVANLTITAPATPLSSTTTYAAFAVEATVGTVYGDFPGIVTNSSLDVDAVRPPLVSIAHRPHLRPPAFQRCESARSIQSTRRCYSHPLTHRWHDPDNAR